MKHIVYLVLFISLSILTPTNSIKCYQCNSRHEPNCISIADNSTEFLIDCDLVPSPVYPPLNATMCRMTKEFVHGEWHIIRGCGFIQDPIQREESCVVRRTAGIVIYQCSCNDKDGCNASSQPETRLLNVLITAYVANRVNLL